jgi:hypothetical protein
VSIRRAFVVESFLTAEALDVAPILTNNHDVRVKIAQPARPGTDLISVESRQLGRRRIGQAELCTSQACLTLFDESAVRDLFLLIHAADNCRPTVRVIFGDAICLTPIGQPRTKPNEPERRSVKFGSVRPLGAKSAEQARISPNIRRIFTEQARTMPNGCHDEKCCGDTTFLPQRLNGDGDGDSVCSALRKNTEELLGFCRAFQVEVVLADNALGVARLQRGLADGPELRNEHRDIAVPHDVMGEIEFLHHPFADMLEVGRDDWKLLQRVGPEPRGQIRLDRDIARLAHLRDLAADADQPGVEIDVFRSEPEDFTGA